MIELSWPQLAGGFTALAAAVGFLFKHILATNAARIEGYKKVVENLEARLADKNKKIEELYERIAQDDS